MLAPKIFFAPQKFLIQKNLGSKNNFVSFSLEKRLRMKRTIARREKDADSRGVMKKFKDEGIVLRKVCRAKNDNK